jgi:hypothetical protein
MQLQVELKLIRARRFVAGLVAAIPDAAGETTSAVIGKGSSVCSDNIEAEKLFSCQWKGIMIKVANS